MRRILLVLVLVWLASGAVAAVQRNHFTGSAGDCDHVTTIAATMLAGPMNYAGAAPSVTC
jgi:hypothetical protein